ncbi:inositol monophosphatase family protein [Streptococcus macacae]|uniref:Inositol monophosphatase family protein n=1 Tax=Streptococcus macacae NCTC 11558 TaxID=764298 RepID=G5JVE3_9STRE|nr:inositol monophosphatase family protein [Streptococcus macacae]EHJ52761.1 inositol monophosphatase family protein [Streptococcus macacae NCTC 11558]SUN78539.1 inositol monophosphatase family protein [Streptococcus macacae NCTC 11558]
MESKFQFAKEIIGQAGQFIRKNMTKDLIIEEKTRFDDLVTELDKEVQTLLVDSIHARYPNDCFLAEENNLTADITKGSVWVIDPIDGTVNFVAQGCDFAVMIAYYEEGQGQFGLIYDVMNDVLYSGGGQFDVTANGQKLPPFTDKPLSRSLICVNSSMASQNFMGLANLGCQTLGVRCFGSAGLSICRVLSGRLLAYFSKISPWDYAAGSIMGEKLGYKICDFYGKKPNFETRQEVMFVPKEKLKEIQKYVH